MTVQKLGRYEIKSEIGRGGMATVYHAHDPRFRRDVALKVLPREFMHNPEFRTRFEREAQTIAALEHPAIVPVYDFGEADDQLYLVMRFLPGGTLTARVAQGALPLSLATYIINRLAPALDEAHKQGIIHRDLKPDNILFDQRGEPYITDFGIVKLSEESGAITTGGVIIGTPAYMSPEQARGEEQIDGRSDIYALGVILFQMLTGKLPYNANTPIGLVMQHIMDPVPRILDVKPDLPPGCETIIAQAMAKERNERYARATTLAAALTKSVGARPLAQPGAQPEMPGTAVAASPIPKSPEIPPDRQLATTRTLKIEQLACPDCGTSLSGDFVPNQQFECAHCGTLLVLTDLETEETIVCPKCHTPNHQERRFCSNCGEQIKIDCVSCHTPNRFDATHCVHCGTDLVRAQTMRRQLLEAKQQARAEREQAFKEKEIRQRKERLQRLINDLDTPAKHAFTIYQLNQLGPDAIEALIDALAHDNPPHIHCGAAKALEYIYTEQEIKGLLKARAAKALATILDNSEPAVRYWAAKALSQFKGQPGQLAVDALALLLNDPYEDVREQARYSLQEIGGERAQKILQENLDESGKGFLGWIKS
jgi:serine/threonine-protein kinase